MKIETLILNYVNRPRTDHQRKKGIFWASELSSIIDGWTTPEHFFEEKPKDAKGAGMILTGIAMEEMLRKIFEEMKIDCEYQVRKEVKISDEITLVVKPDFVFKDFVIETKFPFSEIKDTNKYAYQLEAEWQCLKRKVYLGVLSAPFNLRLLEYKPSKVRWDNICKKLIEFNEKLKVINNK